MTNKTQAKLMSIKVPLDLHEHLAHWASKNVSSINAELVRSARERVERERRKGNAKARKPEPAVG